MPYIHGKGAAFVHGGLNLSPWLNEATTAATIDVGDTSHFGSTSKTYIMGINDGTISGSGLYDGTVGGVEKYFEAAIASETNNGPAPIVTFAPEGLVVGATAILAFAKTTAYSVNPVVSDVVSMSFDTQVTGGLEYGVVLNTGASVTATTAGTAVDNAVPTTAGGRFFLHVLSNANTANVTGTLQHSTNNSTWVDLVVLPVVPTGTTTAFRGVDFTGTVNRYLRLNLTLAGTGAVSVVASVARN